MDKVIEFKVVAVSENTNSFGLKNHVLISRTGIAYSVLANALKTKKEGDVVRVRTVKEGDPIGMAFSRMGFECPAELSPAPSKKLVKEVWA